MLLILSDLVDSWVALATSSEEGFVSSFTVCCYLKDLLHTTKRKDVLLSEQTRLQQDVGEWIKKFEDCRKEGETRQQQLQVLRSEIEENKAKLAQQETVLHVMTLHNRKHFVTCVCVFPWKKPEKYPPMGLASLDCPV